MEVFIEQYRYVVQQLIEKGIETKHAESLFLDPPCDLAQFMQLYIHFPKRIANFIDFQPRPSSEDSLEVYLEDLRARLFAPLPSPLKR